MRQPRPNAPRRPFFFLSVLLAARLRHSIGAATLLLTVLSMNAQVEHWRAGQLLDVRPTLQAAIDAAAPGDALRLREGIYHENVRIVGRHSPAGQPVVIEPVEGAHVILDGADPQLQQVGNGRWTALPDDAGWEATVPWIGRESRALLTWASHADDRLIAAHSNEVHFLDGARGDASWRVGANVKLRLADGRDPNSIPLNIGRAEGIIQFEDSSGWIVRGLTLRHAGFAGVHLNGAGVTDITLEDLVIRTAFRGISTEERANASKRITVRRCRIQNFWNFDWGWSLGYRDTISGSSSEEGAPMRGHGIRFAVEDGEITECEIAGQWDGMMVQGARIRVHRNIVHHTADDMLELESGNSSHIQFHDNVGFRLFVGISLVANRPGPIHIYRNRIQCIDTANMLVNGEWVARNGYPLKFGRDWGPGAMNIHVYQNTFQSTGRSAFMRAPQDSRPEGWRDMSFVNNIFQREGTGGPRGFEAMGPAANNIRWEGNLFSQERELTRLAEIDPVFDTAGLVADSLLDGQDQTPPLLAPGAGSPAITSGSRLAIDQGWPDSRPAPAGTLPDIGALPHGESPGAVGPGGPLYLPWIAPAEESTDSE